MLREIQRWPKKPECPLASGEVCPEHGFVHGQEAEELRAGIERFLLSGGGSWEVLRAKLSILLDRVDARDSLAYLERANRFDLWLAHPNQTPALLLKTWAGPFEAVWSGDKLHEVRADDKPYAVGSLLLLRETEEGTRGKDAAFTGRRILARVTHVTGAPFLPPGLVVMSLRVLAKGTYSEANETKGGNHGGKQDRERPERQRAPRRSDRADHRRRPSAR